MAYLLVVEDDAGVSALVKMNLELVGHQVEAAYDGAQALDLARGRRPDLALVDLMLPKIDGWELTQRLCKMQVPVIILTARDALPDRVRGLSLGADDYIVKPFEAAELLARVGAVLRRVHREEETFELDGVTVRMSAGYAQRSGEVLPLTHKEFDLLCALIRNRNLTLSREKLLAMVWGYDYLGETRTVDLHVQRLRKKLGWESRIVTAYRQGYRLEVSP